MGVCVVAVANAVNNVLRDQPFVCSFVPSLFTYVDSFCGTSRHIAQ